MATMYFNPRLREGGDSAYTSQLENVIISIHASEKEATRELFYGDLSYDISIHASEKEATRYRVQFMVATEFQSTPPRRRRLAFTKTSIDSGIFQSTPPRRRRLQHIVIPQLSCTYLVSTTFLSAIFSFISQYIVLFFLF